jgi:hypothetical protein
MFWEMARQDLVDQSDRCISTLIWWMPFWPCVG